MKHLLYLPSQSLFASSMIVERLLNLSIIVRAVMVHNLWQSGREFRTVIDPLIKALQHQLLLF